MTTPAQQTAQDVMHDLLYEMAMLVLQRQTYDDNPDLQRLVDDAIALTYHYRAEQSSPREGKE